MSWWVVAFAALYAVGMVESVMEGQRLGLHWSRNVVPTMFWPLFVLIQVGFYIYDSRKVRREYEK